MQKSEKGKKSERRVEWSYIGLGKKKGRELLVLAIKKSRRGSSEQAPGACVTRECRRERREMAWRR